MLGTCRRSLLVAVVWNAWRHLACCVRPSKLATMATGQPTGKSCNTACSWAGLQMHLHSTARTEPGNALGLVCLPVACTNDLPKSGAVSPLPQNCTLHAEHCQALFVLQGDAGALYAAADCLLVFSITFVITYHRGRHHSEDTRYLESGPCSSKFCKLSARR